MEEKEMKASINATAERNTAIPVVSPLKLFIRWARRTRDHRETEAHSLTVGQWLDTWSQDYLGGVKPSTVKIYQGSIRNYIRPVLGDIELVKLRPQDVQKFINSFPRLSPATIRLACKVLSQALNKAVALELLPKNPVPCCTLPRLEQKEIQPVSDEQAAALLSAAQGGPLENLLPVALFTGLRLSELLGLTWHAVDLDKGTISVDKQLARRGLREGGIFTSPKNGKARAMVPADTVLEALRRQKEKQDRLRTSSGGTWKNQYDLVFPSPTGDFWEQRDFETAYAKLRKSVGLAGVRFHDLRHSYVVNALRAGDDLKTIQGNLGHSSAAFTLDRYAHFTEQMTRESAVRMEQFIHSSMHL